VLIDVSKMPRKPGSVSRSAHGRGCGVTTWLSLRKLKGVQDEAGRLLGFVVDAYLRDSESGRLMGSHGHSSHLRKADKATGEANEKPHNRSRTQRLVTLKAVMRAVR